MAWWRCFVIRCKKENFIIATSSNGRSKYTIIDTEKGICGPDDRGALSPFDYSTQEGCENALLSLTVKAEYRPVGKPNANGIQVLERIDETKDIVEIVISQRHQANIENVIDLDKTLN